MKLLWAYLDIGSGKNAADTTFEMYEVDPEEFLHFRWKTRYTDLEIKPESADFRQWRIKGQATGPVLKILYKGGVSVFGEVERIKEIKGTRKCLYDVDLVMPVALVQSAIVHYWHSESQLHKKLNGVSHPRQPFSFVPPLILPQKINRSKRGNPWGRGIRKRLQIIARELK